MVLAHHSDGREVRDRVGDERVDAGEGADRRPGGESTVGPAVDRCGRRVGDAAVILCAGGGVLRTAAVLIDGAVGA